MADEINMLKCDDEGLLVTDTANTVNPSESAEYVNDAYRVAPRHVVVISTLFGVSCLTVLVVVGYVRDADGLATIALILAIFAFLVQLIVFAVQNQSATQQLLRSEQLNTQTRSLLTEIQTTALGTESLMRDQFAHLLRAFLDAARSAGGVTDFDPVEFESRIMENIRRDLTPRRFPGEDAGGRTREMIRQAREARQLDPLPFPTEAIGAPLVEVLRDLSEQGRERLRALAVDRATVLASREREDTNSRTGYEGLVISAEDDALIEKEFAELVSEPRAPARLVTRLTEFGIQAADLLRAAGPIPAWARPLFPDASGETRSSTE
jgi:hypothetical protein